MSNYEPYPISNVDLGIVSNRKPWLLPEKAFQDLLNLRIRNGRLARREGFELFGYLGQKRTQVGWNTGNGGTTYSGALSGFPVVPWAASPSTYAITVTAGAQSMSVTSNNSAGTIGNLTGSGGSTGTLVYATGFLSVVFGAAVGGGTSIDVVYEFEAQRPCMFVGSYVQSDGTEYLIAMDTRRMWLWNSTESRFYEVGTDTDKWTLTDVDYFDVEPANDGTRDIVVLNNTKSAPKKFYVSGGVGNLSDMATNFDGSPGNDISAARFARMNKARLVYLAPTELGTFYPGRARWTNAATVETMSLNDYADEERISFLIGLAVLREEIFGLFNNAVFKLRYTQDFRGPFEWVELTRFVGCRARKGTIEMEDRFYFPTPGGIEVSNGEQFESITEQQFPDFELSINSAKVGYMYGMHVEQYQELWWIYAQQGATTPDRILVYNYRTQAFTKFAFDAWRPHVMGLYSRGATGDTWDTKSGTWDTASGTWDDAPLQAGFPTQLIGSYTGRIYASLAESKFDEVSISQNSAISSYLKTKRLNPFVDAGQYRRVRMGHLQLMFRPGTAGFTVRVKGSLTDVDGVQQQKSFYVSLDPEGSQQFEDHIWKTLDVNMAGSWFEIEISQTGGVLLEFDAIVPWFKEDGPLRSFGVATI